MEYCEKGELYNHIIEEICLNEKEASYYFYQLINGLEYLHKNGIVHRDLKSENLLINKNNILKIIDFGLSNYYDNRKLLSSRCGSPSYAAPEVIEGKKYDGIMVDIWSTGIILYSMLCGCFPFNDDNKDILYEKIIKGHINYPDNLDEDAIDLIKKILVNEPKRRISLQNIKKHIFYQKGRKEFIKMYNNIIKTNKENIKSKTIEDTRRNHNNYRIKISNFTNNQRIINNLQMSTDFNNMSKNKKQIYSKNDSGNKNYEK